MAHRQPVRSEAEAAREIPDKLYFRIGEVAQLCDVPAYVLRFWETEFPQLRPNKGGTGQRLYRKRDVEMALRVKRLLYDEGYTIPGARQLLKSETRQRDPQMVLAVSPATEESPGRERLLRLRSEMRDLLRMLSGGLERGRSGPGAAPPRSESLFTASVNQHSEETGEP